MKTLRFSDWTKLASMLVAAALFVGCGDQGAEDEGDFGDVPAIGTDSDMDDAMDDAGDAMHDTGDAMGDAADDAGDAMGDAVDRAGDAAGDAADDAEDAVDDLDAPAVTDEPALPGDTN